MGLYLSQGRRMSGKEGMVFYKPASKFCYPEFRLDIKTEDCDAKLEIPSVKVKSSALLG